LFISQHAIALGNDKPKRLQQTENALWAMLLNMAIGLDQREEMSRFFDKLDEFDLLENEPMEEDWFVKGGYSIVSNESKPNCPHKLASHRQPRKVRVPPRRPHLSKMKTAQIILHKPKVSILLFPINLT